MEIISQICLPRLIEYLKMDLNFLDSNCVDLLRKISPTKDSVFGLCSFGNVPMFCDSLFSETVTEEGICFTFNLYNSDQMMNSKR